MLDELTVIPLGKLPVAILLCAIAALPLISASTIVPLTIFALATVTSVGKAPLAIAVVVIVSVPNLPDGIVPDVNSVAFKPVRLPPPIAGSVAGNLAFGIVPDVKLDALNEVKSTVSKVGSPPLFALKNLPLVDGVPCNSLSN